jgi:hypothetical protein
MSSKGQQAEVNLNKFNFNDLSKIDRKYCKKGQLIKNTGTGLEDDKDEETTLEKTNGKRPFQLDVTEIPSQPSQPKKQELVKIYRYPAIEYNKDFKDFKDRETFRASQRYKKTNFP